MTLLVIFHSMLTSMMGVVFMALAVNLGKYVMMVML